MKYPSYKILILLLAIFLSSCYPEWRIANSFIKSKPDISIMILPTNYVFKENLKRNEAGDTTEMTSQQVDSTLMVKSVFLKDISDSIFLETFINSMIDEFEKLGFKVYTDERADTFLFMHTPAYILNIAQIKLEEHYVEHEDEETFGDYEYHKTIDLNALTYNFWFEFSELNNGKEQTKLFFSAETIHDLIDGYFTENIITGDVKYRYNISEIDTAIIYRYCDIFGRRYAGYVFDYLMNRYIKANWPSYKTRHYYMHYNRENRSLDPTWDDKFIEMKGR